MPNTFDLRDGIMSGLELKVIPDVVWLVAAGLMWLVATLTPSLSVPAWLRLVGTLALLGAGLGLIVAARADLARAHTTFNPMAPNRSSDLVTTGVYRFTRNPMYLGMLLVLVAFGAWLSSPYALIVPVAFAVYIARLQIRPEERVLRARFGSDYNDYVNRVRRWF